MEDNLLIYIILSFAFGYWLSHFFMIRRILKNPQGMIELLKRYQESDDEVKKIQNSEGSAIEVEVVKEQNSYYLYSKFDNQFLGQGHTLEDALDNTRKRFPNKSFKGIISKEKAESWGLNK